MSNSEIDSVVQLLAKLPGLGPRSARRATLYLLERREQLLAPLATALGTMGQDVQSCSECGNFDNALVCHICRDPARKTGVLCVVESVSDLWAMDRSKAHGGNYHVLGGVLNALDGVGPDELRVESLVARLETGAWNEVILALGATVDGQTTAHYLAERLQGLPVSLSRLAHGVPVGGELEFLDDGTLSQAMKARRPV